MQIFKVLPSKETEEICEGTLQEHITPGTVLLVVDHEPHKIFLYKGRKSRLSLQVLGSLLAQELRKQLKLFYQVIEVPGWETLPEMVSSLLESKSQGGKAKEIKMTVQENTSEEAIEEAQTEESLRPPRRFWGKWEPPGGHLAPVHHSIVTKDVLHKMGNVPPPVGYFRNLLEVGGELFSENVYLEAFLQERQNVVELEKVGSLPDGFTFIKDLPFRLFAVRGQVEAIEYLIPADQLESKEVRVEVPVLYNDRLLHQRDPALLLKAFQLPPEDEITVEAAEEHGGGGENVVQGNVPASSTTEEEQSQPNQKQKPRPFTI